jgi:SAM-dependent methyltransferase
METKLLSIREILLGYDRISQLYPYTPSLCIWRSWEIAAYRRYRLREPVIDIGCGDGRFFKLVWPKVRDVVGIEIDPEVADAARKLAFYKNVYVTPASQLPIHPHSFYSAFANCSLEHMDDLHDVLINISRSLQKGGRFLFSIVTDKFLEWLPLSFLMDQVGLKERSRELQTEYEKYHHLVNPLPAEIWMRHLEEAGFEILEYTPILPEMTSRLFLFLDHLWHLRQADGELGRLLASYFASLPHFTQVLRNIMASFLKMEKDWLIGSGAIFYAKI